MSSPSPYLIANANSLLGEFATCLPTELNQNVYSSLLKSTIFMIFKPFPQHRQISYVKTIFKTTTSGAVGVAAAMNSCLNEVSLLLSLVLKYVCKQKSPVAHKLEALLQVWVDLIADWSAWDEEEDLAVFDAIKKAFAFNETCHLKNYTMADVPPLPAPPIVQHSICEGLATFICSAIEFAYSAAIWCACYLLHSLLNIPKLSVECEALRQTIDWSLQLATCIF